MTRLLLLLVLLAIGCADPPTQPHRISLAKVKPITPTPIRPDSSVKP
jgi:hypothetical protein